MIYLDLKDILFRFSHLISLQKICFFCLLCNCQVFCTPWLLCIIIPVKSLLFCFYIVIKSNFCLQAACFQIYLLQCILKTSIWIPQRDFIFTNSKTEIYLYSEAGTTILIFWIVKPEIRVLSLATCPLSTPFHKLNESQVLPLYMF